LSNSYLCQGNAAAQTQNSLGFIADGTTFVNQLFLLATMCLSWTIFVYLHTDIIGCMWCQTEHLEFFI